MIQSFSAEIIIIIAYFLVSNSHYYVSILKLDPTFRLLAKKSSSEVNEVDLSVVISYMQNKCGNSLKMPFFFLFFCFVFK